MIRWIILTENAWFIFLFFLQQVESFVNYKKAGTKQCMSVLVSVYVREIGVSRINRVPF